MTISVIVGIVIGLSWYYWRQRCKARATRENERFRLIGTTFDGRAIGICGGRAYAKRKNSEGWDRIEDL